MNVAERARNRMERASEKLIEDVFHRERWTPALRDRVADFFETLVRDELDRRGAV